MLLLLLLLVPAVVVAQRVARVLVLALAALHLQTRKRTHLPVTLTQSLTNHKKDAKKHKMRSFVHHHQQEEEEEEESEQQQ